MKSAPKPLNYSSGSALVMGAIGVLVVLLIGGGLYYAYQLSRGNPSLPTVYNSLSGGLKPTVTQTNPGPSSPTDTTDAGLNQDMSSVDTSLSQVDSANSAVDAGLSDTGQANADLNTLTQ